MTDSGIGEDRLVPVGFKNGSEIVRMLLGKVARIANTYDALRRIVPKDIGWEGDQPRSTSKIEEACWQSAVVSAANSLQLPRERVNVPVCTYSWAVTKC